VESNILLVLKNAAQSLTSLGTESTGDLNVIVISDGMQRSADLSVACLHPQTAIPENGCISVMTTEELLGQAQETGLVPALSGAKIWFVGPLGGRTANGDLYPTGFEDDVNAFWRDVVLEGGGELCFYAATGRVPQSNCGGS
jgi:hypothetical protein